MNGRHYGLDNIKAILIFCVVFGHLLEIYGSGDLGQALYFLIYTFHMPVFLFLFGYCAKFSVDKVIHTSILYILFQTMYLLFSSWLGGTAPRFQFTTPYWLLWYLLTMIYDYCTIPLLRKVPESGAIAVSAAALALSLAVGYIDAIGYKWSLSRFLVFLPFFVSGYFAGQHKSAVECFLGKTAVGAVCGIGAVAASVFLLHLDGIRPAMLYGSYPYSLGYGPGQRLLFAAAAALWTGFFLFLAFRPFNRQIPVISSIGGNTLSVFLFHGFIVKFLAKYTSASGLMGVCLACILAAVITILLSNPVLASLLRYRHPGKR